MISKEEVKKIAKLARLGLNEKEISKLQGEMAEILDYVEKLKEVDVLNIKPTNHSVLIENIERPDIVQEADSNLKKTIQDQAPDKKDGYFKVRSIFK